MKHQRHTRKESFSVLFISNTGKGSRQFHMSQSAFRLLFGVLIVICAAVCILIGLTVFGQQEAAKLRSQLNEAKEQITRLEAENGTINAEVARLSEENEMLTAQPEDQTAEQATQAETAPEDEESPYPGAPDAYPYQGTGGILISSFTDDAPYMSINTHADGVIVAAADGTVVSVSSDETYPLIVELSHTDGYTTRYLCRETATTELQENAQVKAGDTLFAITVDNTQFDYQILLDGEPIDPLMVIEAKG